MKADSSHSFVRFIDSHFGEFGVLKENVAASALTTFGLGAAVPRVLEPYDVGQLQRCLAFVKQHDIETRFIGNGSNIVLPDSALSVLVVHLGRVFEGVHEMSLPFKSSLSDLLVLQRDKSTQMCWENRIEPVCETIRLLTFAGVSLMGLSRRTAKAGLVGLEFAAGIPASIGGAAKMNAGAHGAAMEDVVDCVHCINRAGELIVLNKNELAYGYRTSAISEDLLIVAVELLLSVDVPDAVCRRRQECLDYRCRTQPIHLPSSGSVFKNPRPSEVRNVCPALDIPKIVSAGKMLEDCGLKGVQIGGVGYSTMHANWLVKFGSSARAEDVVSLVNLGRNAVSEKFAVALQTEIALW